MENRIEKDELFGREYLPDDSPIAREITARLQAEVDAWMEGIREENRDATKAAITAIKAVAGKVAGAGIHCETPEPKETWRLEGLTEAEWDDMAAAWATKEVVADAYWRKRIPDYDEE